MEFCPKYLNSTALILSTHDNYVEIISLLLKYKGIDVNIKDIKNHNIF